MVTVTNLTPDPAKAEPQTWPLETPALLEEAGNRMWLTMAGMTVNDARSPITEVNHTPGGERLVFHGKGGSYTIDLLPLVRTALAVIADIEAGK